MDPPAQRRALSGRNSWQNLRMRRAATTIRRRRTMKRPRTTIVRPRTITITAVTTRRRNTLHRPANTARPLTGTRPPPTSTRTNSRPSSSTPPAERPLAAAGGVPTRRLGACQRAISRRRASALPEAVARSARAGASQPNNRGREVPDPYTPGLFDDWRGFHLHGLSDCSADTRSLWMRRMFGAPSVAISIRRGLSISGTSRARSIESTPLS